MKKIMETSTLDRTLLIDSLYLGGLYFICSLVSLYATYQSIVITPLWLSNVFAIVLLLRHPVYNWTFPFITISFLTIIAFFIFNLPWPTTGYLTFVNLIEITLVASLLNYYQIPEKFDNQIQSALILTFIIIFLGPCIRATLATFYFAPSNINNFWTRWVAGDGICMLTTIPIALCLMKGMGKELAGYASIRVLLLLVVTSAIIIPTLLYFPYSYIVILAPLLLVTLYNSIFISLVIVCGSIFLIFTLYNAYVYTPLLPPIFQDNYYVYLPNVLLFIITYFLAVFLNILKTTKMQLSYNSTHDKITGLLNRHEFERFLYHALEDFHLKKTPYVLCHLNLDNFKIINDAAGYTAGDRLLQTIGEVLYKQVEGADILARVGGDEFGILLLNCSTEKGEVIAHKLLKSINDLRFPWRNKIYRINASLGAVSINTRTQSVAQLLNEAVAACYAAKARGGNQVAIFHAEKKEFKTRQQETLLAITLPETIDNNRLTLYAQKIVPLNDDKKYRKLEILLRMRDKRRPFGAKTIILIAERFNSIVHLDHWVFNQVLRVYDKELSQLPNTIISMNISAATLSDPTLPSFLLPLIKASALSPEQLCFEITETAAMTHLKDTIKVVNRLQKIGCKISLDDFGVGLSSFSYIKNFVVDFVKIDGSFVKNINKDKTSQTIVYIINEMAHRLGIQTVAEHVENEAILNTLMKMNVDYAQGYVICKPEPLRQFFNQGDDHDQRK